MSIKDDIINKIDDPNAFTNQVSNLVHMPASVVKSLTEPLGLRDYMNLSKAVDEEDPESAKEILFSGYENLDDSVKNMLDEYTSKTSTASKNVPSAGNTDGNTTMKTNTTQGTQSTQPTQDTNTTQGSASTQADKMTKDVDKDIAGSIKKLQNDPNFAKIIKFADIVAKNKK